MDIDKAISTVVRTGKVYFGTKSTLQSAKNGKAKLVIITMNCPPNVRDDVEKYCKLSKIPVITYRGSSKDLAAVCGKPFIISALAIRELGDSEILGMTEKLEPSTVGGST